MPNRANNSQSNTINAAQTLPLLPVSLPTPWRFFILVPPAIRKQLFNQHTIATNPQALIYYHLSSPLRRHLSFPSTRSRQAHFKVPKADIEFIRSKLAFKIFDEYANMLEGMSSTRFNGCPKDSDSSAQADSAPCGPIPLLITSLQAWQLNNIRRLKEKEKWDRE